MYALAAILTLSTSLAAAQSITLDWDKNMLIITTREHKIETHYLEAYCRSQATYRKWELTTIPHKTVRLDGTGKTRHLKLRCEVEGGVTVDHDIRVVGDGVSFRVTAVNHSKKFVDVVWAQPCVRLADFTGLNQETYIRKSFIFVEKDGREVLTRLSDIPRNRDALYLGGQVYVPSDIDVADVNPRPVSPVTPSNGLIGAFSKDDKQLFAMAWDSTQELFQGVIVCLHSDFRIGGLKPGEKKTINGRVYLMPNDPDALLRAYKRDFQSDSHANP